MSEILHMCASNSGVCAILLKSSYVLLLHCNFGMYCLSSYYNTTNVYEDIHVSIDPMSARYCDEWVRISVGAIMSYFVQLPIAIVRNYSKRTDFSRHPGFSLAIILTCLGLNLKVANISDSKRRFNPKHPSNEIILLWHFKEVPD